MGYEFESDEEMIECYQEAMMTSKDDILSAIRLERMIWNAKAKEDTRHSAAYYGVLNKLTDRFISKIENTILFDAPYGMWAYMFEVTSDGMVLRLEHASSVDFDDDKNPGDSFVDQDFDMVTVHTKMLTVDEYAQIYGVEAVTVRQWIRRGKLRTAKKYGKEWRIPELTDTPERGYRMGQYKWDEKLSDVPEEFIFLAEPGIATLYQDEKDKMKYRVSVSDRYKAILDGKEREKLELFLISHPLVRYISDGFGYFAG